MDAWYRNEREGYAVGAYGYFLHTRDGGKTWEDHGRRIDNPDTLHLYAIAGLGNGLMFIAGEEGSIHRSLDSGETWERLDSPYSGGFFGVFGTDREGEVYVFGLNGTAYHSVDHGDQWQKLELPVAASLFSGRQLEDGRRIFAGQNGVLLLCNEQPDSCVILPREKRQVLSSVLPVGKDTIVAAGMGGISRESLPPCLQSSSPDALIACN